MPSGGQPIANAKASKTRLQCAWPQSFWKKFYAALGAQNPALCLEASVGEAADDAVGDGGGIDFEGDFDVGAVR